MGWLRDFMNAVEPPLASFGQLAELCLAHPHWPSDTRPKPRSLSTLFSKLDRGQELDWLRDRPETQQVLALLLRRPLGDVRLAVGESVASGDGRILRLHDVRFAREVDLAREPLPPGIPSACSSPPGWGPSWWVAAPGAGKGIVAAWLKCRGLAHVAVVSTGQELAKLPSRGPLYVELDGALGDVHSWFSRAGLDNLRAQHRPVLLVSVHPPPPQLPVTTLQSPPVLDYLPELVDWVRRHLDDTGHFQPDRAEQWLRRVAVPMGAAQTFGDVLGLLGMMDEMNPRTISSKSLDEVGEHFVMRRVQEATLDSSLPQRLSQTAYADLLGCAARCLVEAEHDLSGEHAIDTWTALLSRPQTQDAPDPEWFDVALRGSLGDRIARRDLKRAALKWQPSAFSMVRALGAAQLLVPPSRSGKGPESDLRCLRPRWLLSLLKARAANTLLQHSSLDWGRVLVAGQDTDRVILALLSAAQRGDFTPYFRILEDFDAEQFEAVAALEGATIACGLFLLTQGDLPEELSSGLAQFTAETAMVVGSELLPRSVQGDQAAAHFVVSTWQVAVACLCRELPFPLAHLDPFRSADPTRVRPFIAGAQRVIELKVARWAEPGVATPERATLGREIVGLLALLEDLLDAYAACASPAAAKELTPAYLQLVHSWNVGELFSRAQHSVPLFILVSYAETRGQSRAQILGALWQVLALEPALQEYFIPSTLTTPLSPADAEPHLEDDLYAQLWGQLPLSTLHLRLDAGLHIAWQHIRPHQFSAWINQSERGLDLPQPAAPYCPLDAVLARVDNHGPGAFSPATLATFVERAPGRFAERLTRYLVDAEQLSHLLKACPPSASVAMVAQLPDTDQLLRRAPSIVDAARLFLMRAVRERHPHFEQCYARLAEIEQRLWPLRNLP